jgi:hypothetical protein
MMLEALGDPATRVIPITTTAPLARPKGDKGLGKK